MSEVVRVLHSVSNMDRAGIETMLMNYYRHMDRSVIQFDFLCNKTKPGAYDEEIKSMGGYIYHTPGLNPIKYGKYLGCMREIFKKHPEYKIVEAHNGALGVYALHAAKVNNVPHRIFHAHGASITKDWKLPIKLVCRALLPSNMNVNYSCGIAAAKCYFGEKIVEEGKYTFIPNAIEVGKFTFNNETRARIRKEYRLDGLHVVGHVGRFMPQKNHEFILKVFVELTKVDNKVHLVLLGDGELLEATKQLAIKMGIKDKVTFVGNVGNVNEWYQAFDCFVLPSIWEGLPVVGVEAQAADLPCIFSDNVTTEIGLSDKSQFISLNAGMDVWICALKNALNNCERKDNSKLIADNHYDIGIEAIKLQKRYLKMVGKL